MQHIAQYDHAAKYALLMETAFRLDQRGVRTALLTSANERLKLLLMAAQIPGEVLAANEFYSLVVQHRGPVFDTILGSQSVSKLLQGVLFSAWPLQASQADVHHSKLSFHAQLRHALIFACRRVLAITRQHGCSQGG